ncbi:hypothetical protein ACFE04_020178 [Oxalis oulophora]
MAVTAVSFCNTTTTNLISKSNHRKQLILNKSKANNSNKNNLNLSVDEEDNNNNHSLGVKAALSILKFYKRELSPLIPKSCRFVPTCSEYSMEAYKKYGFSKGTALTACRLCRCNPLGGSGFDPPRWFNEEAPIVEDE